ncbi:C-terminal s-isoprenylcysteine carboxyl o-methyltransferase [Thalictrum thalictroides]|uniref:C-terminal s-isoprenylcysteine carboxyl o-methyltransferase n=1 Tax=Thalictrum thalictroides TaxID=46969 RepID=A0A7J6WPX3_THATH|nr:C-terminal s-isoprenylcysteine carboxyl o-methyltransferase [Thalictrum thalictroides]
MVTTTSVFLHSPINPFCFYSSRNHKSSLRHSIKHLQVYPLETLKTPLRSSETLSTKHLKNPFLASLLSIRKTHFIDSFKCSYSSTSESNFENPVTKAFKNFSFDSLKETLSQLTTFEVCKWCGVLCIVIAATKWTVGFLLNPFFWMYFSWTWLFWPWFLAIALAGYGVYCLLKHNRGEANIVEQLAIVTSAFTWLTLVPPAHFNGYLEGWPFVFFFIYHYFFFFNVSVRKRLYGDYFSREHDPKWDVRPAAFYRILFCVGVMVGHWLAAFEGPELHLTPGGWSNFGIWVLIMMTLFMQYHSTLYLAKYSEKVVVPTSVVQFGPYRFVRHPIYASVMLLFATYFVALRAPLSLLFVTAVCVLYYDQKVKLEEHMMIENFGERYKEYMSKVRYKFIPFVY